MDLSSILIGMAADVGAPLVKQILEQKFGAGTGQLAEAVIKSVATQAGTTPAGLPNLVATAPEVVREAVVFTESIAPELVGLYMRGLEGQFALLQAETAEGPLQSGWRWGWMYLLAVFWALYLVIFPVFNAVFTGIGSSVQIEVLDASILLTLTSWFIALYMGGHTVKELGKTALDAVRSWKIGKGGDA